MAVEISIRYCKILHDPVVVSCKLPNTYAKLTCKHNLETSSISRCIFSVRFSWVILIFQRSKSPFYVARFLGQLLNFIFGRRLKSDHYRNFHTFEVAILTHQYQYTFTTPISLPLFIVLINIGLSAFPSTPILIFPNIPSKSLVLRSILLMHVLSFCS